MHAYLVLGDLEGGITLSGVEIALVLGGLGCAGIVGLLAWFVYWGVTVASRPGWQGYAERIIRQSRAAHSQVRLSVQQSPKHVRKTLARALGEADRLLHRQQQLRSAAVKVGRGLGRTNVRKIRNDLRAYSDKEAREPNPRVRSQYTQARKALEAQVAHYNAVNDRLRKMLEAMREIQSTLEAMQPRIARLAMYEIDTDADIDVAASREVLEDLDLLIGELEAIDAEDALVDMELIEREVERDARRRVEEGRVDPDQEAVAPPELRQ